MTTPPDVALALAVHHVSFLVEDLDAALGFYVDVLGRERSHAPTSAFRGSGSVIELIEEG